MRRNTVLAPETIAGAFKCLFRVLVLLLMLASTGRSQDPQLLQTPKYPDAQITLAAGGITGLFALSDRSSKDDPSTFSKSVTDSTAGSKELRLTCQFLHGTSAGDVYLVSLQSAGALVEAVPILFRSPDFSLKLREGIEVRIKHDAVQSSGS